MRKKKLKLVLLLVVGTLVFLWLIKAPLLSSYMTKKMGIPVSAEAISIRPDYTLIRDFKIKNPRGFRSEDALKAKKISIDYTFQNLKANPCQIDKILMENVFLSVDFARKGQKLNNWTAIAKKMKKGKSSKEVVIHKLVLTGIQVEIKGLEGAGGIQKQFIERIELSDLDSKEGFPTKEVVRQVFGNAGLSQYIEDVFNPERVMEEVLSPFSGFGT